MRHNVVIDGRLIGYRRGGIANYARQLAEHAPGIASDLEISVAIRRDVPRLSDRSRRALTPPHHRLEPYTLGAEMLFRPPDLFHGTDYVFPLLRRSRTVVTVHDLAFLQHPEWLTPDALRYYRRVITSAQQADMVIAVSEWTRDQLVANLNVSGDRIRVIPNGIDPELFNTVDDGDRERLRSLHPDLLRFLDSGRPIVLAVSTIEPRKRYDVLIDAFERMSDAVNGDSGQTPLLVVAGQAGWLAGCEIQRLRALQRFDRARWLRDVDDRELAALYRAASLLVMPSADEGFGLPALEAMACGTPVLAAANGALPELIADSGFLEETDDPTRWMSKIIAILQDDEMRKRRSRRGHARAASYTWRETARKTVDVYREVLGRS